MSSWVFTSYFTTAENHLWRPNNLSLWSFQAGSLSFVTSQFFQASHSLISCQIFREKSWLESQVSSCSCCCPVDPQKFRFLKKSERSRSGDQRRCSNVVDVDAEIASLRLEQKLVGATNVHDDNSGNNPSIDAENSLPECFLLRGGVVTGTVFWGNS